MRLLPVCLAALGLLAGPALAQQEENAAVSPAADCRLCHVETVRALEKEPLVHRLKLAMDCASCHSGAAEHAASLGVERCLDEGGEPFASARAGCADCHPPASLPGKSFHPAVARAPGAPAFRKPERPPVELGEWQAHGVVEAGYRAVDGGGHTFRTFVNRQPGMLLRRVEVDARRPDPDVAVDHVALDLSGVGDPVTRGKLLVEDTGNWRLRARGDRYEDLFDASTDLHDVLTVRKSLGADLEFPAPDGDIRLSWTRQTRTLDAVWTRYRPISNERFLDTDGFSRETADLFQASFGSIGSDWQLRAVPAMRWWRESDSRFLFQPNALRDDLEDYEARSSAWTPSLLLQADGPLSEDLELEVELLGTWSRRRTGTGADTAGVDAVGAAYRGRLGAETEATGTYLRAETALFWEVAASLGAELRLRWRKDKEEAETRQAETVTSGGTTTTAVSQDLERARLEGLDTELLLRARPLEAVDVDLGYGARSERLRLRGANPALTRTVTHGVLGRLRLRPLEELTLQGDLRAYTTGDPYTSLTPDREDLAGLEAAWKFLPEATLRGGLSRSRVRLLADGAGADQDRQFLDVSLHPGEDATWDVLLGTSRQSYATDVTSRIWIGGFPVPYEARFAGHWRVWWANFRWQPIEALELHAGGSLADTEGDDPSRFQTLRGEGRVAVGEDLAVGLGLWSWLFDSGTADADDFRALALEAFLELRF